MSRERLYNVMDEMEKKTSFLDLPNEIIVNIFMYLDIPSRFKMRLNKRLNQIQGSIKNRVYHISIDTCCINTMKVFVHARGISKSTVLSQTIEEFSSKAEPFLQALAKNGGFVGFIYIKLYGILENLKTHILNLCGQYKVDRIRMHYRASYRHAINEAIFPHLIYLAHNAKRIQIDNGCEIAANDLCILRKVILEGNCRLESLTLKVKDGTPFVEACFGLTVHYTPQFKLFYLAENEPCKIYAVNKGYSLIQHEDGVWTSVRLLMDSTSVDISKTKPNRCLTEEDKLKLNHPYA